MAPFAALAFLLLFFATPGVAAQEDADCKAGSCEETVWLLQHELLESLHRSEPSIGAPIGIASTALDGSSASCRDHQCQLGEVTCRALVNAGQVLGYHPDICMFPAGGLGASLPAGNITKSDLEAVFPYGNHATFFTMKGDDFTVLIEKMLNNKQRGPPGHGQSGTWLQMYGMRFQATWGCPPLDSSDTPCPPYAYGFGTYDANYSWCLDTVEVKGVGDSDYHAIDNEKMYAAVSMDYMIDDNDMQDFFDQTATMLNAHGPKVIDSVEHLFENFSPVVTVTPEVASKRSCLGETCDYTGVL